MSRDEGGVGGGGLFGGEEEPTCPLLTPSPTPEFQHPLAISTASVSEYDRQLSPSSVDTEASSCLAVSTQDNVSKDLPPETSGGLADQGLEASSSSSSCSVMQDSTSSAQLLNSRNYLSLATDPNCQENGGIKGSGMVGLTLGKATQEFAFTSWNWPLIRRCCFWGVASVTVACVCVIIGYITTIPNRCDPPRTWHQGALIYQVFPASFQDSDGTSVGDLRGVTARLDYIQSLGAKAVRLSYVFPAAHFPEDYEQVTNLSSLEPALGGLSDMKTLAEGLHRRNMSLILDLPLHPYFTELKPRDSTTKDTVKHLIVNNHILVSAMNKNHNYSTEKGPVTEIISFWMDLGVDGFYLLGLHEFVNDDNFLNQIEEWRSEIYHRDWAREKILICSEKVLKYIEKIAVLERDAKKAALLNTFDLVDYRLDPYVLGTKSISEKLNEVMRGDLYEGKGPKPWPLWSLAGVETRRLSTKAPQPNLTLAAILTSMALPGTASLLYGDEIGLQDIHDPEGERRDLAKVHSLGPMVWKSGGGFTRGGVLSWLPIPSTSLPDSTPDLISLLSSIKDINPPLYMQGVWNKGQLESNTHIRFIDNEIVTIERTYPRRHSFLLIANLSPNEVVRDLSKLYYGGSVVLDTAGPPGRYITFQSLPLGPGHVVVTKLDK